MWHAIEELRQRVSALERNHQRASFEESKTYIWPGPTTPANHGIIFFDLDHTLTTNHTGGELGVQYTTQNNEEVPVLDAEGNLTFNITLDDIYFYMGGKDRMFDIVNMIMDVRNAGYLVYINTRGLEESCIRGFNTIYEDFVGPGRWIEGVVGAKTIAQIADPYPDSPPDVTSEVLWARRKTELMDMVTAYHGIYKENALFFDDTQLNIDYAKEHGYWRSYAVSPNAIIRTVQEALAIHPREAPSRYQTRRVIVEP